MSAIQGQLQFNYDAGTNNNFLDSVWIKNTEDSIRLFYRKDATEEWQFANDSLSAGSLFDKRGNIYAKEIKAGEYTFGIKRSGYTDPLLTDAPTGGCGVVTNLNEGDLLEGSECVLFPNPTSSSITLRFAENGYKQLDIQVTDQLGRLCMKEERITYKNSVELDLTMLPSGIYILQWADKHSGETGHGKVIKE